MASRNKYVEKIVKKRRRGRPSKDDPAAHTVPVALSKELLDKLDEWRKQHGVKFRSAAIRRFVEEALQRGKR